MADDVKNDGAPNDGDEEAEEEPTCRLIALNDDCLSEIFSYLGPYEFVQLSRYSENLQNVIKNRVIGSKMVIFRGPPMNLNKKVFELFGDSMRNIRFTCNNEPEEVEHFAALVNKHCSPESLRKFSVKNVSGSWWQALRNAKNLTDLVIDGRSTYDSERILTFLRHMPKLKRFKCENFNDKESIGGQIAQYCPQIEKFYEKCHSHYSSYSIDMKQRYNFILNFANLKSVGLTATTTCAADLYEVMCGLAEKNTIEEMKINVPTDDIPMPSQQRCRIPSYVFDKFTSLKSLEVNWFYSLCNIVDISFFRDLLANLKCLKTLVLKASHELEAEPVNKLFRSEYTKTVLLVFTFPFIFWKGGETIRISPVDRNIQFGQITFCSHAGQRPQNHQSLGAYKEISTHNGTA